jgi:hypothetical protein
MVDMIDESDEFTKRMEAKYPKMLSGQYGGMCVSQGWYHIIELLFAHIQSHIDWNNARAERHPDLRYEPIEQVVVEQIKEKFGGLRFYYRGGNDIIAGMVAMAESFAEHTCETCGAPGTRRSGGWIRTLCDKHEEERQALIKEK